MSEAQFVCFQCDRHHGRPESIRHASKLFCSKVCRDVFADGTLPRSAFAQAAERHAGTAAVTNWTAEEQEIAAEFNVRFRRGVVAFCECGEMLLQAKGSMEHGRFVAWVEAALPIHLRTAQQFMQIAGDPNIRRTVSSGKSESCALLPLDRRILAELCGLEPETFDGFVEDGVIHADMKRGDVKRAQVAAAHAAPVAHAAPLPEGTYGAILADPPWRFRPFGDGGLGRAPESHYPTMATDDIAALPVGDLAAKDCALFLWTVPSMLLDALTVMRSWGFEYRTTAFVWHKKGQPGLGYWTRKGSELCLLGLNGAPKRLSADVSEVIHAPRGKHSEKPGEAYRRIERLVAGPYMELFARKSHLGWNRWGNDPALAVKPPIRKSVDPDGETVPDGEVDEVLQFPGRNGESCRIQLHRDRESGLWMWAVSVQFPSECHGFGFGHQVGPKWGKFAEDRASALHWAFEQLIEDVERQDSDYARKILKRIREWREDVN